MSLTLPHAVINYLAAVNAEDPDMLALCFSEEAVVRDEGRDYRGLEAIQAWSTDTHRKYRYSIETLDATVSGTAVRVRAKLTGNFPGSPVELQYRFTLAHDKITALTIE